MRCPRLLLVLSIFSVALRGQTSAGLGSSSQPKHSHSAAVQAPDAGAVTDDVYRNATYSFSYKIPFGWVERTDEMQNEGADDTKSRVLLAIFERPPAAPGDTVNSAVVIAAEKATNYPGLKSAADYFGPLEELVGAKGFKVVSGPDEFAVGTKKLVRGDFAKDMPGVNKDRLSMQQSTLVELERGYIVSFTFIAGDEDEVEELIGNLSFAPRK